MVMLLMCIESQLEIGERKAVPRTVMSLAVVKVKERKSGGRQSRAQCLHTRESWEYTVFDDVWLSMWSETIWFMMSTGSRDQVLAFSAETCLRSG